MNTAPKSPEVKKKLNNLVSKYPKHIPLKPTHASPRGWKEIIEHLGGTLDTNTWTGVTPELTKPAPVRNILEQAGKRALVRFENKNHIPSMVIPIFPKPNAKVLLVGADGGQIEIIALHRSPKKSVLFRQTDVGGTSKITN